MSAVIKCFQEMREMSLYKEVQLSLETVLISMLLILALKNPKTQLLRYVITSLQHSKKYFSLTYCIQDCSPYKHGWLKKLIIKPMEETSQIKETTLSVQVSVGFNNQLRQLNTNQGNSLSKLQLKGKKDNLSFLHAGN